MDEELFAQYGVEEGGEEQFREEVQANMERELTQCGAGKVKQQVMDAVVDAHDRLEFPQRLLLRKSTRMRKQMFQQFGGPAHQDMDLKSLLPDDMFKENAERASNWVCC